MRASGSLNIYLIFSKKTNPGKMARSEKGGRQAPPLARAGQAPTDLVTGEHVPEAARPLLRPRADDLQGAGNPRSNACRAGMQSAGREDETVGARGRVGRRQTTEDSLAIQEGAAGSYGKCPALAGSQHTIAHHNCRVIVQRPKVSAVPMQPGASSPTLPCGPFRRYSKSSCRRRTSARAR